MPNKILFLGISYFFFISLTIIPLCFGNETMENTSRKPLPQFLIMTEDWPPYQFKKGGTFEGIAVDLMVLMLKKTGSNQNRKDIFLYPWARGYDQLLSQENTILFSMTRTNERENLFKWVGPIFTNSTFLIAMKSKNIKIISTDDIKQYRIGTIIKDASELFVTRLGIPLDKLQRNTISSNNVKKLAANRIDFVVSGWTQFENDANFLGIDPELFESVYEIDRSEISYAFNKKTPDWIIEKFQKAFDLIIKGDELTKITKKYSHLIH
jgi:polar amino acid transport system substrate-binding protein